MDGAKFSGAEKAIHRLQILEQILAKRFCGDLVTLENATQP